MSASLILRWAAQVGAAVGNLSSRWANTVGTPIVSVTERGDGNAIADSYTLTFTGSGGSVTCAVGAENPKNPNISSSVVVVADGSTPNTHLIPGFAIVLSASTVTNWAAEFTCGAFMDNSGVVTDCLNFDVVQAGLTAGPVRIACCNVGDADAADVAVFPVPGLFYVGTGFDTIIASILPHSSPSRHQLAAAATKLLTFGNWGTDGPTGKKKCDVVVNGVTSPSKAVIGALFDGSTVYEYGQSNGYDNSGDQLAGLGLVLANTTADPTGDTITLKVSDGWQWLQFAPEASPGTPGTFACQTGGLTLTEAGQSPGIIRAGQAAFFWAQFCPPSYALAGDMRKLMVLVRGLSI